MRWRSFQATVTAAALVLGVAGFAHAQDIDAFADLDAPAAKSAPPPQGPAPAALVDKSPTGSLGQPGKAPVPPTSGSAQPAPAPAIVEKSDDPDLDLDGVTSPATPAPSKDPLDADKPDAAKPDATKPDAAKLTPTTPDATGATGATTTTSPAPAVPAVAALPPVNAAIKAALDKRDAAGAPTSERRKERAAIDAYYAAHEYAPAWSEDATPVAAVDPVLARLAKAGDDALTIPSAPNKLVTSGAPDEVAASDIALTDAVVAYARQATGSRVDPRTISPLIGARPELADPAEVIDTIAAAGAAAGDDLEAMNPRDPRYVALRDKLEALRGTRSGTPIPRGPTLKIGMHDPRVKLLRARFGLPTSDFDGDDDEYDLAIAEAVSGFQRSAGLPVSGHLTQRTVAALSGGGGRSSPLEATLAANMEMWRWMPRQLGQDRIEVDVPAFTVTVYHDGDPVTTHRVVVGKTDTPTPLFSNTMKYLIVNPVWNVPESIIKKEFLPKGEGYMAAHGFDVSYRHGRLVVKQPSGAKNALGRIKFMFPNDYSVYLHDTPSKSLFAASRRAFSHGCVRVDQPFDFAFDVLNDSVPEGGKVLWSEKRLDSLLGDKERYVNLPRPLPIHIEYFTAAVDGETGNLVQREDIYGYTHDVAAALGLESPPAVVAERKPHRVAASVADEDPR